MQLHQTYYLEIDVDEKVFLNIGDIYQIKYEKSSGFYNEIKRCGKLLHIEIHKGDLDLSELRFDMSENLNSYIIDICVKNILDIGKVEVKWK